MLIRGYVTDSQPNQFRPKLDLYFDKIHRNVIPRGERARIVLELGRVRWNAELNSTNQNNAPYVLTRLTEDGGTRRSCTDVFLELGIAEKAELQFELVDGNNFRLVRIVDKGKWRAGGAPYERTVDTGARVRALSPASPSEKTPSGSATKSFPFDDRSEILRLANLYWDLITSTEASEEHAFEKEMPVARRQGFLNKPIFVRLARWKSVRQTPNYESNDEASIRNLTLRAFAATDERTAILALTKLRGVALRTATAILHWMRPDFYPILDFRVVGALGRPEPLSYEDIEFYSQIANEIRAIAKRHGLDLRTVDRALWAWQKLQGKDG